MAVSVSIIQYHFGGSLGSLIKATIALFTWAGPAPHGQIGSHFGLFRFSMGVILSQL